MARWDSATSETTEAFSRRRLRDLLTVVRRRSVAQVGGGRAVARYGNRPVLVALAGVGVLPLVALPFVSGVVPIAVVVVLVGIQLDITPVTNTYIIDALPPVERNGAWGFLRTGYFLVASTGSVFVGVLVDAGRFDAAFLRLGGLLAVLVTVSILLPGLNDKPQQYARS